MVHTVHMTHMIDLTIFGVCGEYGISAYAFVLFSFQLQNILVRN